MGFTSLRVGGLCGAVSRTSIIGSRRTRSHTPLYFSSLSPDGTDKAFRAVASNIFSSHSTLSDAAMVSQVPSQTFEPVVNMPAVFAFLFISVVFSLLQIRISGINRAAGRRSEALQILREVKSIQLSASDLSGEESRPSKNDVARALAEYEKALREELDLRTVIPGVRIVAPNDPKGQEDDLRAVRQFLDMDISEGGEIVPIASDITEEEPSSVVKSQETGMSSGSKAVLAAVALVQVLLLVLLSFDPMTADNFFTIIGGQPPEGGPLSSW